MPRELIALGGALEIKAAEGGDPSRNRAISTLAYNGGALRLAAYEFPVVVDLSGLEAAPQVQLLANHENDTDSLIGRVDRLENDGLQLVVHGELVPVNETARSIVAGSDRGLNWQTSIGCVPKAIERVPAGRVVSVNGREFTGPIIIARSAVLREVSITPMGVDPETVVRIAASMPQQLKGSAMSFEDYVKSLGLDPATLPEAAKAVLMEKHAAMSAAPAQAEYSDKEPMPASVGASPNPTQASLTNLDFKLSPEIQARIAAETNKTIAAAAERADAISKIAGEHPAIKAKAIRDNWTLEKTELEVMKASRFNGAPPCHVNTPATIKDAPQVLEAAICIRNGMGVNRLEKFYKPEVLEAAEKQFKGGIGPRRLLDICARENGYSGYIETGTLRDAMQAAFSTAGIRDILSNTQNKFLLDGFMSVEDGWEQIASIRSVNDFKTVTSYRLVDGGVFEKVAPTGELKHGTMSEESYTNKVETYGKMYAINRQMIINDDLGALSDLPRHLGRQARLKLLDVFWTEFFADHATFFNTDNSKQNYLGTSASALSVNSLTSAETLFFNKVDPNGNPLNVDPAILLVPNALYSTATGLMAGTEIRDNTASAKYTTNNIHQGKFSVVRSSYLSNASYGNSTTGWYLLADPSSLPMIEVAFLGGQRTPTIENADADFSTLGIQMRGFWDFGVNKQDYRAAVKNTGV